MRISDWSSDVCSSDLAPDADGPLEEPQAPESNQPKGLTFGPGCRYHRGNAPTALRSDRTTDDPCPLARQALKGAGEHGGYPDLLLVRHLALSPGGGRALAAARSGRGKSEEHPSELPSLMRRSSSFLCL